MGLKKEYSKNQKICKVTFSIPKEIADNFGQISLVGDFNHWDPAANLFAETKSSGEYVSAVELSAENKYRFRYLADGVHWFNENEADDEEQNDFGSKNSVLVV
ncbi:MAG: glycoside hydrolase family 13 [Chlorobi bacterium]|nr:glycoside hydrolase family 13 [Chlorobiota bacterium]